MCGIYGFIKQKDSQTKSQLKHLHNMANNLAVESEIRGKDSTGISIVGDDIFHYRFTMPSSLAVKDKLWDEAIASIDENTTIFLGHVRLATHGKVTIKNTHPFEIDGLVGAHNGVLSNYLSLEKEYGVDIEVDSEVILHALNRENTAKEAFEKIEGDFAVTYYKTDDRDVIYFAREYGRPLWYTYWRKAKTLFWASTKTILDQALVKSGIIISETPKSFPQDTIGKWDSETFAKVADFESTKFTAKVSSYHYGKNGYSWGGYTQKSYYDYGYCGYCGSNLTYKQAKEGFCATCLDVSNRHPLYVSCSSCKNPVEISELLYLQDVEEWICDDCFILGDDTPDDKGINNCIYCGRALITNDEQSWQICTDCIGNDDITCARCGVDNAGYGATEITIIEKYQDSVVALCDSCKKHSEIDECEICKRRRICFTINGSMRQYKVCSPCYESLFEIMDASEKRDTFKKLVDKVVNEGDWKRMPNGGGSVYLPSKDKEGAMA